MLFRNVKHHNHDIYHCCFRLLEVKWKSNSFVALMKVLLLSISLLFDSGLKAHINIYKDVHTDVHFRITDLSNSQILDKVGGVRQEAKRKKKNFELWLQSLIEKACACIFSVVLVILVSFSKI